MATPNTTQNQQQKPSHAVLKSAVAAALAAGGASLAELPAAAGGVADAKLGLTAGGLSAKAVADLTEKLVEQMQGFLRDRAATSAQAVMTQMRRAYPERAPEEVDALVGEEVRRERVFQRKMLDRLRRDLPEALRIADPEKRRARVAAVLQREQRYVELREEAMHDRAIARAEMLAVKEASPHGAFWQLSPNVKQHTPDCIALAGQFWPWEVIEAVGPPPRHHGCRCSLLTEEEAVDRDLMDHGVAEQMNVADAMRRARKRLADAETVMEALDEGEWEAWLDELVEGADVGGGMIALYPHPELARRLAVPGGDPPDQLHVTLKFLGSDHHEIPDEVKAALHDSLAEFARGEEPLKGQTAGPGFFPPNPNHKGDETPIFAKVDVPGIHEFRKRLVDALPSGVMEDTFPDFKPHMTLQYVPKTDSPDLPDVPVTPLHFDRVVLVFGGRKHAYHLGTGQLEEADSTADYPSVLYSPAKCHTCGKPATKSLVHAEGRAYVKVCDDCEAAMRKKLGPHSVDREVDLMEGRWQLRYQAGYEHGGEFMPKLGGNAGRQILSDAKRALLKATFPELPNPRARHDRGRVASIGGRPVYVPEHRMFDRTIGGHRYTSPPFSTNVYRNGKPYTGGPLAASKKPALAISQPHVHDDAAARVASLRRDHGERHDEVMAALAAHHPGHTPAHVGADGETTDRALTDHGFIETSSMRLPGKGFNFTYRSPDGVSVLSVDYGLDGKVAAVTWEPKAAVPAGRPATNPPVTFQEFLGDAATHARRLAASHGRNAHEGDWRSATTDEVAHDAELGDHGAEARADGTVVLGKEYAPSIFSAAVTRKTGGQLSPEQKRDVWAAYQGASHEAHHQAVPLSQALLRDDAHYNLNEALVEDLSHEEAARWLDQTGQHDVLQWRADNPTSGKALGTYVSQRAALDRILDEAKIAPELRSEFKRQMFGRVPPKDRFRVLAEAVAAARGGDAKPRKIEDELRSLMRSDDWKGFAPSTLPDVEPTTGAESPFTLNGKPVRVGHEVSYTSRTLRDGRWQSQKHEGTIAGLHERDGGRWTMDVTRPDGSTDYAVLPQQVTDVHGEGRKPGSVFGAGADVLHTGNGEIREGNLIRYDGRADGGYSTARVVRIIRDRNPHLPEKDGWLIEAVTTDDSLAPGTRVLLTPDRVGGQIAPAGRADNRHVGGEGVLTSPEHSAPRLEDRALLSRWFDLPDGTFVVPTARLIAGKADPPGVVTRVHAALHDAAGPAVKMPPLAVHPTTDGRFVVTEGNAALEAAKSRGLSRLPVLLNAVSEVDRHLRSADDHARRHPSEAGSGTVEGLKRARQILAAGGRAEDIARDAFSRPGARAALGAGDREDGFQTGMRSAFKAVTESPRAASMALYSSRQPGFGGWGLGFKPKKGKGTPDDGKPAVPKWFQEKLGDWGAHEGSTHVPKPQEPRWDDSETVRLTKAAGGSNGAMFGEDKDGRKWLVKSYKGDADRIATELLANAVYRRLGIKVPEAGTLTFKGKPALAYPLVDGVPGGHKSGLRVDEPSDGLAKGFMADAYLANWDVVGLEHDNLLWPEGTEKVSSQLEPVRLDHGGTLQYRAMGGKKTFGPVPTEVWTMASPKGGQAFGTMRLTDEVKRDGARAIAEKLDDGTIDELVDAAPFKNEQMRQEVREALKARRDWMRSYADGVVSEPKPVSGNEAAKMLTGGQSGVSLYPEQEAALRQLAADPSLLADDQDGASEVFRAGEARPAANVEGPALVPVGEPDFSQQPDKELKPGRGPSYEEALKHYHGQGAPKHSAGVIVVEPDGRVWTFEPKGHFGGYERTLSKGRVDPGQTEQQAALRELWEETGLVGEITGDVGWYAGSTTLTHYFTARRTGGAPWGHDGKETAAVYLQSPRLAAEKLQNRDRMALRDAGVLDPKQATPTKELDGVLRHVKTRGADATLYGALDEAAMPLGGWESLVGRSLEHGGYTGLSLDRKAADAEGHATVRLHVPEGSTATYLRGLPEVGQEFKKGKHPDVLLPRRSRMRVVRVSQEKGRTVIDAALT